MSKRTLFHFKVSFICEVQRKCNYLEHNLFQNPICITCIAAGENKSTTKALLCDAQYFYIVDSDM